jgi:hypothetical protein
MAKAHTQDWYGRSEPPNQFDGNSCFARRAWARGENNVAWPEGCYVIDGQEVVAADDGLAPKLAYVPRQIMDEGIVVIDD